MNKSHAKLISALSCIHSSQTRETQLSGPASLAIIHGVALILDGKGMNDKLLGELAKDGMAAPPQLLRKFLRLAAAAINANDVCKPPPAGMIESPLVALDNADFHLLGAILSVIPLGNILLGYEKKEDVEHFDKNFLPQLPIPSEEMASKIMPTSSDDEEAKMTMRKQNILALLNAVHLDHANLSSDLNASAEDNASEWDIDMTVSFCHRHVQRQGVIKEIDGNKLRVYYREADGDDAYATILSTEAMPITGEPLRADANEQSATGTDSQPIDLTECLDEEEAAFMENFVVGVDDGGGRHKTLSSTTIIREVLDGVSSKHDEAATKLLEHVIARYCGDNDQQQQSRSREIGPCLHHK